MDTVDFIDLVCNTAQSKYCDQNSHFKGVLLVVLQPVVQQHTQGHDTTVKFAVLCCPVGVNDDGWFIRENVAPFSPLALKFLLPLPFLLLREKITSVRRASQRKLLKA